MLFHSFSPARVQAENSNSERSSFQGAEHFHGDTEVLTITGYKPIRNLSEGQSVWSRDDTTGEMGWKRVLAQYSNAYDETVEITLRDTSSGARQTIVSNRVHPFFVQVPEAGPLLHLAGHSDGARPSAGQVPPSSEGHTYRGVIENGHWVDAANLLPGYRLLNGDESWSEVFSVTIRQKALKAYNLTVADHHTYFVRGPANDNAKPVWVHNDCFDISRIRPAAGLLGGRKHGVNWSEQDALARAVSTNIPRGKFGSQADINYVADRVRNLGSETGKVTVGIKDPIPLPIGHTSKVIYPDGTQIMATHVWVRVNKKSGTLHMYPIVM